MKPVLSWYQNQINTAQNEENYRQIFLMNLDTIILK